MSAATPRITVIGSINMDLVVRCGALPLPGQTILADSSAEVCGGKGANQAVAAARAGSDVTMVGRVGEDAFAGRLVENLREQGINCDAVRTSSGTSSGVAVVAVEAGGQNSIMVVSGANADVGVEDVEAVRDVIEASEVLLLQLEIPLESVLAAKEIAREAGVRVVLDPAPVPTEWPRELLTVDLLCPNESEAAALSGIPVQSVADAEQAARQLHSHGAAYVAVTLGEQGTLFFDGEMFRLIEPYAVTAIDTTAAGDAFAGACAVRWAEGAELEEAIRFGNAAGALAASREGAQPGMAMRSEIETLWRTS